MSVLKIYTYPDEILKRRAEAVENIDGSVQTLIDDMVETMYAAPGIGLAAPQVGRSLRVIVVDVSGADGGYPLITLVNPEIVDHHGVMDSEEGCLSVPNYTSTIRRHASVLVRGIDRNGKEMEIEAEGLLSRALQHEIDHLDGILFVDRMSRIKREFFRKRYLKALKT